MGLWAKSLLICNSIREYGKQSIRELARYTGLFKSSVHRHLQAIDRQNRYPESGLWETPQGQNWLLRLLVQLGVNNISIRRAVVGAHRSI